MQAGAEVGGGATYEDHKVTIGAEGEVKLLAGVELNASVTVDTKPAEDAAKKAAEESERQAREAAAAAQRLAEEQARQARQAAEAAQRAVEEQARQAQNAANKAANDAKNAANNAGNSIKKIFRF